MIDWSAIDTVFLDMDGTLLDLHFDNYFWLHHLPRRYAEHHNLDPDQALEHLLSQFASKQGTLDWYCTDYWSHTLAVDIPALKREVSHLIAERPQVRRFLQQLGADRRARILITNAHRHSLNLKLDMTGIDALLDQVISSHDYGAPKESRAFWQQLATQVTFNPARSLFIDDSEAVLRAARAYGIKQLICIRQPDSKQAPRGNLAFPAIDHFDELLAAPLNDDLRGTGTG